MSLPPEPPHPLDRGETKAATAEQLQNSKNQMSAFERSTLHWAITAVIMSALAAIFICLQWYEMKKGSADTHMLAEAAKKEADKAESISASFQNATKELDRANTQAANSFHETIQQSKAALNASIQASRLDERPWIGVVRVDTQGGVQSHDVFSYQAVTISIRNSGKTPAIKMGSRIFQLRRPWYEEVGDYDSEFRTWQQRRKAFEEQLKREHPEMPPPPPGWEAEREAVESSMWKKLFPEGGVMAPGVINSGDLGGATVGRRTKDGRPLAIYILGKITYHDTLGGTQHTTEFCIKHLQGNSFTFCLTGNWMN